MCEDFILKIKSVVIFCSFCVISSGGGGGGNVEIRAKVSEQDLFNKCQFC